MVNICQRSETSVVFEVVDYSTRNNFEFHYLVRESYIGRRIDIC